MTNEDVGLGGNSVADRLQVGPREGVTYPIQMKYCGHCTMPIEVSERKIKAGKKSIVYMVCVFPFHSTASTIRSTRNARNGWSAICRTTLSV